MWIIFVRCRSAMNCSIIINLSNWWATPAHCTNWNYELFEWNAHQTLQSHRSHDCSSTRSRTNLYTRRCSFNRASLGEQLPFISSSKNKFAFGLSDLLHSVCVASSSLALPSPLNSTMQTRRPWRVPHGGQAIYSKKNPLLNNCIRQPWLTRLNRLCVPQILPPQPWRRGDDAYWLNAVPWIFDDDDCWCNDSATWFGVAS